ncbi:tetraspanin-3-like [Oryza brachyantha]|uniref:tetraspanin-3-like n=1 Tax=Oryza brachyantha TaxID=4533 RepID=UPI001ADCF50F|nr:tetraspanin-3-like [Oryza brachyantha]
MATITTVLGVPLALLLVGTKNTPEVCNRGVFSGPTIAIGLFLLAINILGFCCRKHGEGTLHGCHSVGSSIAILAIVGFVVFGYVAVGGIDLGSLTVRTYKLDDYGGWLRGRVDDPRYWATTSACLRDDKHVCDGVRVRQPVILHNPRSGMLVRELSSYQGPVKEYRVMLPIEVGCCMPPRSCASTYMNGTAQTATPSPSVAPAAMVTNDDCSRWSNDEETLCFQCDSCKAVFLDDTKKAWNAFAGIPIICLIILICTCSCCPRNLD